MIKKIHLSKLALGMFVHDLNCGWLEHRFLRSRFLLTSEADLKRIKALKIQELYIDNSLGGDAEGPVEPEAAVLGGPDQDRNQVASLRSFQEEIGEASLVHAEANKVVASMLVDARLGKQVQLERLEPVVSRIMASLTRTSGALLSLNRIKTRDKYTFQHSVSVATLLLVFGRALGLDGDALVQVGLGGTVHDIGKMRVPYSVLNKPSSLSDSEYIIMQSHVALGLELLEVTPGITASMLEITAQHHEKFDGTGYPDRLVGARISEPGRMAAIADVYDALTSNRVYRVGMEPALALRKVFEWGDGHLDKEMVQKFIKAIGIYPVGSLVRLESNRLAVVIEQGESGLLSPVVRIIYDAKHRKPLAPKNLDLGSPNNHDRILGPENAENFNLDLISYLLH